MFAAGSGATGLPKVDRLAAYSQQLAGRISGEPQALAQRDEAIPAKAKLRILGLFGFGACARTRCFCRNLTRAFELALRCGYASLKRCDLGAIGSGYLANCVKVSPQFPAGKPRDFVAQDAVQIGNNPLNFCEGLPNVRHFERPDVSKATIRRRSNLGRFQSPDL